MKVLINSPAITPKLETKSSKLIPSSSKSETIGSKKINIAEKEKTKQRIPGNTIFNLFPLIKCKL